MLGGERRECRLDSAALAGATGGFVAADRTNRINLSMENTNARPQRVIYANDRECVDDPDNTLSFGGSGA
jgi:hypothetical protein